MKIEQIDLLCIQSLQTIQQAALEVIPLVRVLVRAHAARIELRVHDKPTFLPIELAEQSFGCPVHACGVDLVVTVLLEDTGYGCDVFDIVDAGSFGTWVWGLAMLICEMSDGREGDTFFSQSHGSKYHFEVCLCLRWTEVIVHGDGNQGLGDCLGLSGGHFDCAVDSLSSFARVFEIGKAMQW